MREAVTRIILQGLDGGAGKKHRCDTYPQLLSLAGFDRIRLA